MEQTTENLNKFEIEERIEAALPIGLRKTYQQYRTIKPEYIIERLKSTKKRDSTHWTIWIHYWHFIIDKKPFLPNAILNSIHSKVSSFGSSLIDPSLILF